MVGVVGVRSGCTPEVTLPASVREYAVFRRPVTYAAGTAGCQTVQPSDCRTTPTPAPSDCQTVRLSDRFKGPSRRSGGPNTLYALVA